MAIQTEIKVYLYRGKSAWLQDLLCFNFRRKVAESWDEMPLKAALAFAAGVYLRMNEIYSKLDGKYIVSNIDLYHFGRVATLFYMLKIRRWIWKLMHKEVIHSILEEIRVTDFLFASNPTRNFIPFISSRKFGRLYGPENFDCFRGNEFAFADEMYFRYKQGDAKGLDQLIAILYRKGKSGYNPDFYDTDGDRREPFNMHTVDLRLKDIERVCPAKKALIAMWYAGCRHQWTESFPHVFPKRNPEETEEENSSAGWLNTLRGLSGGKFGDMEKTLRYNMYLILCEAEDLIKQAKEAERRNSGNGGF
ncbi:MAG: hypothetical protein ACXWV4_09370 [Flavitalea sp.]